MGKWFSRSFSAFLDGFVSIGAGMAAMLDLFPEVPNIPKTDISDDWEAIRDDWKKVLGDWE